MRSCAWRVASCCIVSADCVLHVRVRVPVSGVRGYVGARPCAYADLHERLRKASPLLMASAPVAIPARLAGAPGEHDAWAVVPGMEHGGAERQTARLDRLLHNTITALQDEEKAAAAMRVIRQLARAQPSLVASRMLLLRGLCAGKALLRLSDLKERGGTVMLLNVLRYPPPTPEVCA